MQMMFFKQKELITQQIIADIMRGSFPSDGRIPSGSELAKTYGVSIVTMREILKSMESFGILSLHHGRGIFVNNPETISDELFDTRTVIESHCAGLAALHRTEEDLVLIQDLLGALLEASSRNNLDLYTSTDYKFHFEIARIGRNRILEKTLQNIRIFMHYQQLETNRSLLPSLVDSYEEHRRIVEAIAAQDSPSAELAMGEHLAKTRRLWDRAQQL